MPSEKAVVRTDTDLARTDNKETLLVDGEERPYDALTFVSVVGPGLVVQHLGWAEEKLKGPGGLEPDPIEFGSNQEYVPQNLIEAKELLEHPHRLGNSGQSNLYCLKPKDDEQPSAPPGSNEIPDGFAKVDGEVVPLEELFKQRQTENSPNGETEASSEADSDSDTAGLTPLTAEGDATITRKQEAVEALGAEGVDFSADDAPSPHDGKDEIVAFAHEQGYYFPEYED